jgi:hypothetical protein
MSRKLAAVYAMTSTFLAVSAVMGTATAFGFFAGNDTSAEADSVGTVAAIAAPPVVVDVTAAYEAALADVEAQRQAALQLALQQVEEQRAALQAQARAEVAQQRAVALAALAAQPALATQSALTAQGTPAAQAAAQATPTAPRAPVSTREREDDEHEREGRTVKKRSRRD